MLKCISKNIIFTCIPLNPACLLNYKCKNKNARISTAIF